MLCPAYELKKFEKETTDWKILKGGMYAYWIEGVFYLFLHTDSSRLQASMPGAEGVG